MGASRACLRAIRIRIPPIEATSHFEPFPPSACDTMPIGVRMGKRAKKKRQQELSSSEEESSSSSSSEDALGSDSEVELSSLELVVHISTFCHGRRQPPHTLDTLSAQIFLFPCLCLSIAYFKETPALHRGFTGNRCNRLYSCFIFA